MKACSSVAKNSHGRIDDKLFPSNGYWNNRMGDTDDEIVLHNRIVWTETG